MNRVWNRIPNHTIPENDTSHKHRKAKKQSIQISTAFPYENYLKYYIRLEKLVEYSKTHKNPQNEESCKHSQRREKGMDILLEAEQRPVVQKW